MNADAMSRFSVTDGTKVLATDMKAADSAHCRAIATYVFGAEVANRAVIQKVLQPKGEQQT